MKVKPMEPDPHELTVSRETIPPPGPPTKQAAERLTAVLEKVKTINPFAAVFNKYAERLTMGREMSLKFRDTQERRTANDALMQAAQLIAQAAGGVAVTPTETSRLFLQLAGRAALTAQWYESLVVGGAALNCPPELVMYVSAGIPAHVAARFYETEIPPDEATKIYGLIYSPKGKMIPLPVPVPQLPTPLKPMRVLSKKARGKR